MLHQAAALRTGRDLLGFLVLFHHRVDRFAGEAVQAADFPRRAVHFQNIMAARQLVQAVNILRDHASQSSTRFPAGQSLVGNIGFRSGEIAVRDCFLSPVFLPGFGAAEEFVEVDRLRLRPDATGRAKIGDTAFGTDTRAGEGDCRGGFGEPLGDLLEIAIHRFLTTDQTDSIAGGFIV